MNKKIVYFSVGVFFSIGLLMAAGCSDRSDGANVSGRTQVALIGAWPVSTFGQKLASSVEVIEFGKSDVLITINGDAISCSGGNPTMVLQPCSDYTGWS